MKQLTINLNNVFEARKMNRAKHCKSGYVRVEKYLDNKVHMKPQMYEGDLLGVRTNGSI